MAKGIITKNSPKNKYRASITFNKPLGGLGQCFTAMGMTKEEVKNNTYFYTDQAKTKGIKATVQILENKNEYPHFNWVEIDRYVKD